VVAAGAPALLLGALAEGAGDPGDGALRASARRFLLCQALAERAGGEGGPGGQGGAAGEPAALAMASRQAAAPVSGSTAASPAPAAS